MTTRTQSLTWSLGLASAALALTACADVSGGKNAGTTPVNGTTQDHKKVSGPKLDPKNQEGIVCQSIREAMQTDREAYDKAVAAGNKAVAGGKLDAVRAGAEGAKSVKGCNVTDLLPSSAAK